MKKSQQLLALFFEEKNNLSLRFPGCFGKHSMICYYLENECEVDVTVDFRFRRTLSAGMASASSGQQNVGHEGVATRCGDLSLCSFARLRGFPLMHLQLRFRCRKHLLFPLESQSSIVINHNFMCKTYNFNCLKVII